MMFLQPIFPFLSLAVKLTVADTWSGWGGGIHNTRHAASNTHINANSIKGLTKACQIKYFAGVSATPTISGHLAYYTTWNGLLVALDYTTCKEKWSTNLTTIITAYGSYDPAVLAVVAPVSRSSPQVDQVDNVMYVGSLLQALIIALDLETGRELGSIQLNTHPLAVVTMSPTFFDGILFIGVSSLEWAGDVILPDYKCCSFVGNVAALTFDREQGEFTIQWDIPTVPTSQGGLNKWSGAGAWGSQPPIDVERRQVFFATGNLYQVPAPYQHCLNSTESSPEPCLPPDILQESIVAVDIDSGVVNWLHQLSPLDAWTLACGRTVGGPIIDPTNCPQTPGPDSDFGMAPALLRGWSGARRDGTRFTGDALVAGQKNGNVYALEAATGAVLWAVNTSPAGIAGGLSWGVAVDAERVYYNAINADRAAWHVLPGNESTNGSAYGALALRDGAPLWGTLPEGAGTAYGPPTAVGDVVLTNAPVAAGGQVGGLVVLSQDTGAILTTFALEGPARGGFAVQDEYLLFGTGYQRYNRTGSLYVMKV
jgi:outer membrane protein assembly factor BamB